VLPINRIPDIFGKIRDGQAPEQFTQQLLRDWGFTSKNDRAFIPLLKTLGFLTSDGKPTQRYNDYRDHSRSKGVMGQAIRGAYSDLFLIKESPTSADSKAIEGKFKSYHNVSDHLAKLMTRTFYGLLALADLKSKSKKLEPKEEPEAPDKENDEPEPVAPIVPVSVPPSAPGLHYNIQIHLPATKDVEVYNAIFKSLREHLINE
ncbi:DUF5343 domain-containing protein, partial [Candidatus Latescibacterota bacterium]